MQRSGFCALDWSVLIASSMTAYNGKYTSLRNQPALSILILSPLLFFKKDFIYFREGKEGRKCWRETSMCGCLTPMGRWPSTQARALSGNLSGTLWFQSQPSIHWATPARASSPLLKGFGKLAFLSYMGKIGVIITTFYRCEIKHRDIEGPHVFSLLKF